MTINLTKEEKAQIISSHIKNLNYTKYNLEIDILQENAKSSPLQSSLSNLNTQIDEVENQLDALQAELASVNALTE
jgi:hypothetical protein